MSHHPPFDRSPVDLHGLAERGHLLSRLSHSLAPPAQAIASPDLPILVEAIRSARASQRSAILMMGGHPLKLGLCRYLIDLIERGFITHLACNGSAIIHDFELALVGGTSEDVTRWLPVGQFGLWRETGRLNDIIRQAAQCGQGLGEAVGRTIEDEAFPHRDLSVAAAC